MAGLPEPLLSSADIHNALASGIDKRVLEAFAERGKQRVVRAGETLVIEHHEATTFYVLLRGSARVFQHASEAMQVTIAVYRAPAIFGDTECLATLPYTCSVQAMEKCIVLEVPARALLEALQGSPGFAQTLLADQATRACVTTHQQRAMAFHPAETRLANLLATYVELYGLPVYTGTKIRIPLTQDDLACALGVARRTITRTLRAWETEDIMVKQGKHFVVKNLEALARYIAPGLLQPTHRMGQRPKQQGETPRPAFSETTRQAS